MIAQLLPDFERLPAGLQRFLSLIGEKAFIGTVFKQLSVFVLWEPAGILKRYLIMRRGFTMRAERGSLSCRDGGVFEDGRTIAGLRCVMDNPRQQCVGTTIDQGCQYQCVQALPSMYGKRICYRPPSKLVPKCNRIRFISQDSAADAFFK